MRLWRERHGCPQSVFDIQRPGASRPRVVNLKKKVLFSIGSLVAAFFIFGLSFVPRESLLAGGLANSVWPKFGNNERNTARQTSFFTQTGDFDRLWTLDLAPYDSGVVFQANPVLGSDGTIYIGGLAPSASVYAINSDGILKWRVAFGDGSQSGIDATIALDTSGNLLVATPYGFFKLRASNGSTVWSRPLLLTDGSSPTIATDGTIYTYGTGDGMPGAAFFALNADGTIRWSIDLSAPARGVPALATDGTIYISMQDGNLRALNPDGSGKWTYNLGQAATVSVMVGADGTVYVAAAATLFAVNPDGTLKWTYDAGSSIGNGLAEASDGTIYFGTYGPPDYVYALNPVGTLKWRYAAPSSVEGGVSVDGQGVIYAPANVSVLALKPDGTKHWQYDRTQFSYSFYGTPVVSADGRLLIVSAIGDGTVTALIPKGLKTARPAALLSKLPTVTIESPKSGEVVARALTLIYKASDPDGTGTEFGLGDTPMSVEYSFNQGIVGTWKTYIAAGKNEGKVEFSPDTFPDEAEVYFRVIVRDRTELFSEAVVGPVTTDVTPPAFIVKAHVTGKPGFIDISVTSTEALKGAPDVYVDQAGRSKVLAITRGEGRTFTARYEIVQGFDGVAKVYVTGTDLAGNVGTTILSGDRFSVFVTPPAKPMVLTPLDGDIFEKPELALSGTSVPTAKVVVTVNGVDRYTVMPAADGAFTVTSVKLSTSSRGKNVISVIAEDTVGVSDAVTLNVIVNFLPKVTISSPRPGRTISDVVKVSWSAQDENADKLRFVFAYSTDDGKNWITTATSIVGTSYAWDTTLAPDGLGVKIRVSVSDGIGQSHTVLGPFTLKNNLPVISIEEPSSLFVNSSTLKLKGVMRSELYTLTALAYSLDRASWTAVLPADGAYNGREERFDFMLPKTFPDGEVVVYFRGTDERKKNGYAEFRFTIDTLPPQPPSVKIDRLSPHRIGTGGERIYGNEGDADAVKDGTQISISGVAEPLSIVMVNWKDGELARQSFASQNLGGLARAEADAFGAYALSPTVPAHGKISLLLTSQDRAGNRSPATPFNIVANNKPKLALTWPGQRDFVSGKQHTLSWRVEDPDKDAVSDFSLVLRLSEKPVKLTTLAERLRGTSYAWESVTSIASGVYELRLSGSDGFERSEITLPIRVDTKPPTLQAALAIPRRTNNPTIAGEGIAYDDFSGIEVVEFALTPLEVRTDGSAVAPGDLLLTGFTKATLVSGFRTPTSTYRFSFPQKFADGTYTLKLRATDHAENIGAVTSTVFTIDTTPPRVGAHRLAIGPLEVFPAGGVTEILSGVPYAFTMAVSPDAVSATLRAGEETIALSRDPRGLMIGELIVHKAGNAIMRVDAEDDLGNRKTVEIGMLDVLRPGRIMDVETQQPIAKTDVRLYFFDAAEQTFRLWDGEAYGQENPQRTDAEGFFRYVVPAGTYELRVGASGYKRVKTSPLVFEKPTLLTMEIPLKKSGWWEKVLQKMHLAE